MKINFRFEHLKSNINVFRIGKINNNIFLCNINDLDTFREEINGFRPNNQLQFSILSGDNKISFVNKKRKILFFFFFVKYRF